ncbi:hypothetical protein D9M73_106740 [compost metagenome]
MRGRQHEPFKPVAHDRHAERRQDRVVACRRGQHGIRLRFGHAERQRVGQSGFLHHRSGRCARLKRHGLQRRQWPRRSFPARKRGLQRLAGFGRIDIADHDKKGGVGAIPAVMKRAQLVRRNRMKRGQPLRRRLPQIGQFRIELLPQRASGARCLRLAARNLRPHHTLLPLDLIGVEQRAIAKPAQKPQGQRQLLAGHLGNRKTVDGAARRRRAVDIRPQLQTRRLQLRNRIALRERGGRAERHMLDEMGKLLFVRRLLRGADRDAILDDRDAFGLGAAHDGVAKPVGEFAIMDRGIRGFAALLGNPARRLRHGVRHTCHGKGHSDYPKPSHPPVLIPASTRRRRGTPPRHAARPMSLSCYFWDIKDDS